MTFFMIFGPTDICATNRLRSLVGLARAKRELMERGWHPASILHI